ncbi:hypothetical protein COCNU_06G016180 [Cocos nucifera]|uniref:Uncharacterized protein n=1 Tax=Cocos nucifera TaxID=13894 RepID=A0A8K0ICL2_COCNU|nr:hypothetical protein COCNU_06G016180 [Cocos nucifera]
MEREGFLYIQEATVRRRRAYLQSDTYVLLEPGKSEEFVSQEELRVRLKGWLENSPGNVLPPDLARFDSIDAAISHFVRSVCELEIDGELAPYNGTKFSWNERASKACDELDRIGGKILSG